MGEFFQNLAELLEKEYTVIFDLYQLSTKKSELILNADLEAISALTAAEQQLILELGIIESKRQEITESYVEKIGLKPNDLSIDFLLEKSDGEIKSRIEAQKKRILELVSTQKEVNSLNERLLKNNLEYIDFSIKLIAGQDELASSYSKGGQLGEKKQNRNLFDKKV